MKTNSRRSDTSSFVSCNDLYDDSSVEMETDHKRKNRNLSEKKRRDQFNMLINELCSMVHLDANGQIVIDPTLSSTSSSPSPGGLTNNGRRMDKSTVLQSAINFLKSHCEASKINESTNGGGVGSVEEDINVRKKDFKTEKDSWKPASLSYEEFAQLMLEAMDAFIVIVDADATGNIVYASESILPLLGYDPSLFFHNSGCYKDDETNDGTNRTSSSSSSGHRTLFRKSDTQSIIGRSQKTCDRDRAISDYLTKMSDESSRQLSVETDGNNGKRMSKSGRGNRSSKRSKINSLRDEGEEEMSGGTSIFDLVHESERNLFYSFLSHHHRDPLLDPYNSILLHFKKLDDTTEISYEIVRLFGSFTPINDDADMTRTIKEGSKCITKSGNLMLTENKSKEIPDSTICFVSIGRLQTPKILKELRMIIPPNGEVQINREFVSRHSLEWKFLFLDHRASSLIGYMPFEVLGTSGYEYYHWDDLPDVVASHGQLMETGEGTTDKYRFLTKGQQWIWLRTRSYITYHQWNSKPEFIVCTHTIIGYNEKSSTNSTDKSENRSCSRRLNAVETHHRDNPKSPSTSLDPYCFPLDYPSHKLSASSRRNLFTHHPLDENPTPIHQVTNHYLPVDERTHQMSIDQGQGLSSSQQHAHQIRKRKSKRNHPDSTNKTGNSSLESGASSSASSNTSSNVQPRDVLMLPDSSASTEPATSPINLVENSQLTDFLNPSLPVPVENATNIFNSASDPPIARSNTISNNGTPPVTYLTLKSKGKHYDQDGNYPRSKSFNYLSNSSSDFLKRRHQLLQDHILEQQEELRRVEQQLSHNHGNKDNERIIISVNNQNVAQHQENHPENMYISQYESTEPTHYPCRTSLTSSGNSFVSDSSPRSSNYNQNMYPEY